jgi:glycine cleavage system H lipoate-binding protein
MQDLLDGYQVKALEYLIAVGYLLLFVPFWRFVSGGALAAAEPVRARPLPPAEWFGVPEGLSFHPGHAWARFADGLVTVGIDDFARKLVGPLDALELPRVGSALRQGEPALGLVADAKRVAVLSPVDGPVVAVNEEALRTPAGVREDPYGRGWLLRVKPERWRANASQLLSGGLARRWIEEVAERLRGELSPALGVALQDGGQPVDGIAKELLPHAWDELARRYLLSEGGDHA